MPTKPDLNIIDLDPRDFASNEFVDEIVELSGQESMVPIDHDSIKRHHASKVAIVGDRQGEHFAGYAAITHVYSSSSIELGGLIVKPEFRGMQIATHLVDAVHKEAERIWPGAKILAFSNDVSHPLFAKLGGDQIEDPDELPGEVWKVCEACVNYQKCVVEMGKRCCGRIFDITEIGHEDE